MKRIISVILIILMLTCMTSAFGISISGGIIENYPSGWEVEYIEKFSNFKYTAFAYEENVQFDIYKDIAERFMGKSITMVRPPLSDKDSDSFKGSGTYASFTINKSAEIYIAFGGGYTPSAWMTSGENCLKITPPAWVEEDGWKEIYIDSAGAKFGEHNGVLLQEIGGGSLGVGGQILRPYKRQVLVKDGETETITLKGSSGSKLVSLPYVIFIKWLEDAEIEGLADWPMDNPYFPAYRHAHLKPAHNYVCDQNPPNFIWHSLHGVGTHVKYKAASYDLRIARNEAMTDIYRFVENIPEHFYTFDESFDVGIYYWQVRYKRVNPATGEYEISKWTLPSRFRIDEDAYKISFPNISGAEVLSKMKEKTHPFYFKPEYIKNALSLDIGKGTFSTASGTFRNVKDSLPVIDLEMEWVEGGGGKLVKDPFIEQMLAEGTRLERLALFYSGSENEEERAIALQRAEETANRIYQIKWPPWNSLTDSYIGEMLVHIAAGYDAFYNDMEAESIEKLKESYRFLLNVCLENSIHANNDTSNGFISDPTNSHLQRIGAEMIVSALIFRDDMEETKEIFDFLLPLYINNYRTYTTDDGLYMNGIGYYSYRNELELADILKYFEICDLYQKSGYINEIDQSLYMWPVGSWGPFGDASYTQYSYLQKEILTKYYDTYNSPVARWMIEEGGLGLGDRYIFDKKGDVESEKPISYSSSKYFKDAGMAALHSDLTDRDRISLFFRSSKWGSYNHSHADQNSFVIDAYGERLAIDSGWYPYYGSPHHHNYTRQTHAHNSITYGEGKGQYVSVIDSKGKITYFLNHPEFDLISGDATDAYKVWKNNGLYNTIDKFERNIIYIRPDMFIIIDDLDALDSEKTKFQFWLNAEERIELNEERNGATIIKGKAQLEADVIFPEVTGEKLEGYMGYDRVNWPKEKSNSAANEIDPEQYSQCRVYFETDEVERTKMITLLDVHKTGTAEKNVIITEGDGYIKLVFEDGTKAYIQTGDSKEITVDNITFNGEAAVLKEDSVMLVGGCYIEKDSKVLYESDKLTSMVFGKDEFSVSSIENDAKVKLYDKNINTILNKRYEFLRPVTENNNSYGIKWKKNDGYSEFDLYNDNYRFYLNNKELPGTPKAVTLKVYIDESQITYDLTGYLEQDGKVRCDTALNEVFGDFEIVENGGIVNLPESGLYFWNFDEPIETEGLNPYIKLKRLKNPENLSSITEFAKTDGKITARAIVENTDDNVMALPVLTIAQYKEGKLFDLAISNNKTININQKDYISVSAEPLENAEIKAFLWNRNGISPINNQAFYNTEGNLLNGITIDGNLLEGFDREKSIYDIFLSDGAVVPVVKGLPAHSGVYTTTEYSFEEGKNTAKAIVTASDGGGKSEVYKFNFRADKALTGHITEFKNPPGGMTYKQYYEYAWGVEPEGDALIPPENTSKHQGPLAVIPRGKVTTFKCGENDALADNAYRETALTYISKASGIENAYYIRPNCAYTWWHDAPEWMYRAFAESLGTFPEEKKLWYSFKVNAPCEVILLVDKDMTLGFAEDDKNWKKTMFSEKLYEGITKGKNEDMSRNTLMYYRKYNKGDTVYLYNLYGSEGILSMSPDFELRMPYMTLVKF